jgi:hypothetical protein
MLPTGSAIANLGKLTTSAAYPWHVSSSKPGTLYECYDLSISIVQSGLHRQLTFLRLLVYEKTLSSEAVVILQTSRPWPCTTSLLRHIRDPRSPLTCALPAVRALVSHDSRWRSGPALISSYRVDRSKACSGYICIALSFAARSIHIISQCKLQAADTCPRPYI